MSGAGHFIAKVDQIERGRNTSEQIEAARRTVATYAVDAAECAEFLAMIGLVEPDAEEQEAAEDPAPDPGRPRCTCGAVIQGSAAQCRRCRYPVPAAQAREVVLDLLTATKWTIGDIAFRIGWKPNTLRARIAPSTIDRRFVSQQAFEDLVTLWEQVAAA